MAIVAMDVAGPSSGGPRENICIEESGPLGKGNMEEDDFISRPIDPGDPVLANGPSGKFWADPSLDGVACEMVVETPSELLHANPKPKAQSYLVVD